MACNCDVEIQSKAESKVLWILLVLNFAMFVTEIIIGILSQSTGLVADSLDMLADSIVYAISLYAIGKAITTKAKAAYFSGIAQITLALGVLFQVGFHAFYGSEPESDLMMQIGFLALFINIICLVLINKHRHGEMHMRASWIFTTTDVIANIGVIISGFLVSYFASNIPDLIVGFLIALVVLRGGTQILKESKGDL